MTAKLTAGGSKSYYLDVPDGSIITCYAYDSNVTVTQSGKNLTVKTSLNSEPYSEIAVQVINKEQTDYIQFVIYLEVTKPDQVGESFYNADDFSNTFFSLMESERRKRSLRPYEYNYDLEMGASTRATEVAMSFSHTRPDGTGYKTVYGEDANGHTYSEIMYRVSVNSADASAVFYAMMDSAEGKTAILSQDFDSAGFGFWVSGSTLYIVGHFVY